MLLLSFIITFVRFFEEYIRKGYISRWTYQKSMKTVKIKNKVKQKYLCHQIPFHTYLVSHTYCYIYYIQNGALREKHEHDRTKTSSYED